ncbi:MAG: DUF1801 domain-containing protein [Bacteroidetes bacterium]|nr:MAG: DUF1801 domain-containing protein [Bacteroidota bacterium]
MNKTQPQKTLIYDVVKNIDNPSQQQDVQTLLQLMQQISGEQPTIWGNGMVGFGTYHYKYESGREGDWFKIGFSCRKTNLTIYITDGFPQYNTLLKQLGKHKTGKSCLYIKALADIDLTILGRLLTASFNAKRA